MAKKILIVEDEPDLSQFLKIRLEQSGYAVFTAFRGYEALSQLKSVGPDLVLLDLIIPDLSGEEVCRRMKRDPGLSNIPVIMLTAKGQDVDMVMGRVIGADAYITKPFEAQHLLKEIERLLPKE